MSYKLYIIRISRIDYIVKEIIMKVKVKYEKCHKTFKGKATDLKNAKALKKLYKENGFTCCKCIGIENGVYGVGVIS